MKRSREEFQGKSAVVTALFGIFSSENSYPRKAIILPAYGKNGGDPVRNRKNKKSIVDKNREKTDTKRF